jgi:hypothetical protein
MADGVERDRGPPLVESPEGAMRFWRIDRYREVALSKDVGWTLDDGTPLMPDDPVLEMHIRGERLIGYLARREPWWDFVAREFSAVVPELRERPEVAIVGSTILRKQVVRFGASTRRAPPSLHTFFDTFYRRLILLAFHPGSVARVLSDDQPLVDAAISIQEFCRRYGAAMQGERAQEAVAPG